MEGGEKNGGTGIDSEKRCGQGSEKRRSPLSDLTCRECKRVRDESHFSARQVRKLKKQQTRSRKKKPKVSSEPEAKQALPENDIAIVCLECAAKESGFVKRLTKFQGAHVLEPAPACRIEGLVYFDDFLTVEEEARVMDICDRNPWKRVIRRRQQFYGEVYYHTRHEEAEIQPEEVTNMLDMNQFDWLREKLEQEPWRSRCFGDLSFPTQILVNEYTEMAGIASHFEDEQAFGPIILTISLLNPILMTLQKPRVHDNDCMDLESQVKVLLKPRSLLVMKEECRYDWRHGISRNAREVPLPDGSVIRRDETFRRVSLTIRHLQEGRRRVSAAVLNEIEK